MAGHAPLVLGPMCLRAKQGLIDLRHGHETNIAFAQIGRRPLFPLVQQKTSIVDTALQPSEPRPRWVGPFVTRRRSSGARDRGGRTACGQPNRTGWRETPSDPRRDQHAVGSDARQPPPYRTIPPRPCLEREHGKKPVPWQNPPFFASGPAAMMQPGGLTCCCMTSTRRHWL